MPFNTGKQPQENPPPPIGINVLTTAKDETSSPGLDIVFVHGLRGHREKTWTSKSGVFWPRDLLPNDLPGARVMSWGYDATIVQFFSSESASQASLFAHSKSLLEDISAKRRKDRKRPILWVCHSLGGLVVKAALIAANGYGKNERFPELGAVYEATIGVLFMGTPHRGSSREEDLGQVAKLAATITMHDVNSQLLRTLAPDSHILEEQRDAFTTISKDLDVVCFWEELKTRPVGLIVPEPSAVYDGFRVRSQGIRPSHSDMRIFEEHEEKIAAPARPVPSLHHQGNISSAPLALPASPPRPKEGRYVFFEVASSSTEVSAYYDPLQYIKNSLSFKTIDEREDSIESAHSATFSWILDGKSLLFRFGRGHPASRFVSWLETGTEPLFWISGKAGSGKSTLMKYICGDPRLKRYLKGMLRSLLLQLIKAQPELANEAYPRLFDSGPNDTPVVPVDWGSLKTSMRRVIDHARKKEWVICMFIDGLDEYRITRRKGVFFDAEDELINNDMTADWDQRSDSPIQSSHIDIGVFILELLSTSHGSLELCVSSRELSVFEDKFSLYPRLRIHEHTADDAKKYASSKLADAQVLNADERGQLVSHIVEKAQGVFLWVRLVVTRGTRWFRRDRRPTFQEALEWLDSLPGELGRKDGLYCGMMNYVDHQDRLDGSRIIRLLKAVTVANRYTSFFIVTNALRYTDRTGKIDVGRVADKRRTNIWRCPKLWRDDMSWLRERLKDCTGGLVELQDRAIMDEFEWYRVKFIHQTAEEFIFSEVTWSDTYEQTMDHGFNVNLSLLAALVASLTDLETRDEPFYKHHLFRRAMHYAKLVDSGGGDRDSYIGLVDELFRAARYEALSEGVLVDGLFNFRTREYNTVAENWLQDWFAEDRKTAPAINLNLPRREPGPERLVGIMRRAYSVPKTCEPVYVAIYGGLLSYLLAKYGPKPSHPSEVVLATSDLWYQFFLHPSVIKKKYIRPGHEDASAGPLLSYYFSLPETAGMLLVIGADPGMAWGVLLRLGYCVFASAIRDPVQDAEKKAKRSENRQCWIGIADALIRYGADFRTPVQLGSVPSEFITYTIVETEMSWERRWKGQMWTIDLSTVLWTICEQDVDEYAAAIRQLGLEDELDLSPPDPWPGYGNLVIDERFYTG
ncbi:hypothetical protein QBC37DRAFT_456012 [Rhypophila decipiens]|uniref:Nephrocystin 3-like N-terminal domain-containing protein n=1 Tax=Rhypophila decipiens TaxID=261697 RepID=A0AAN6YED5_9PEZI|nr:hypothetical protein QBC37DRAFT_456012 [Rhypophila decipiens]